MSSFLHRHDTVYGLPDAGELLHKHLPVLSRAIAWLQRTME
jgi:hypothetical protein